MSIRRFEAISISNIVRTADASGDATPTYTPFFNTCALVFDIKNQLELKERYRLYSDFTNLRINITPNALTISNNFENYAITWRDDLWRITDTYESNDRMYMFMLCYKSSPSVRP